MTTPRSGPEGVILIEPWKDCFGGQTPARLRVNGKLVGKVHVGAHFCVTAQKKWVALLIGGWLGLPVKRHKFALGYVEWCVRAEEAGEGEGTLVDAPTVPPCEGWDDDPFALGRASRTPDRWGRN